MTTQLKAWIEINGTDRRGSAPFDKRAQTIIDRHGGQRCHVGWRFPDGSILNMRGYELFAS